MPTRPSTSGNADHPRSRGVYISPHRCRAEVQGSSPLARGLHAVAVGVQGEVGIIPARAGFTTPSRAPTWWAGDHPRSRGVYTHVNPFDPAIAGSSPLARGLPQSGLKLTGRSGIIPARAGFTDSFPLPRMGAQDHPRSRGVYFQWSTPRQRDPGSSPLARGLRHVFGVHGHAVWIIPARAGFTSGMSFYS